MNEKEIKKNIELKEAYEKLEEELNIKRSWKQEISMIENNDQSKISEMNDDFSKYVSEI